ncbi:MAG: hypothetical protein JWL99_1744 [Streptomyces oryziradicis]|jgi:hypothetical protein|nr:hypothetical protein [Actinacidiphila oryziradicis]
MTVIEQIGQGRHASVATRVHKLMVRRYVAAGWRTGRTGYGAAAVPGSASL